ncbi:MAG TPA: NAD(P)-binding protein, partial [Stellaceae bacterium]|nr:NAD(P)-binding protein [Stellaceae bacterium]
MSAVHVVGAGLAGLAAALRLADARRAVVLHEASGHAGGRCRSYLDATLGCRIDNGNHLLITGNTAAMAYLDAIGARGTLI